MFFFKQISTLKVSSHGLHPFYSQSRTAGLEGGGIGTSRSFEVLQHQSSHGSPAGKQLEGQKYHQRLIGPWKEGVQYIPGTYKWEITLLLTHGILKRSWWDFCSSNPPMGGILKRSWWYICSSNPPMGEGSQSHLKEFPQKHAMSFLEQHHH